MTYKVPVYSDQMQTEIVARVRYNELLDYWNGSNWRNGGVGLHLGITRLMDGRYVLIRGTQWCGDKDYGWVVSDREALEAILHSGNDKLLEEKRFATLKALADAMPAEMIA